MRIALACLLIVCSWTQSQAAVIFSVQKATPGTNNLGSNAVFNVFVRSDAGTITNLAGIDFFIDAADPGLTNGTTAGGRFNAGTSNFFPAGVGGFQAFKDTTAATNPITFSRQVFSANNGAGLTLTGNDTLLATITLGTAATPAFAGIPARAAATAGVYTLGLSNLAAVDPGFNPLQVVGPAAGLRYEIVAVPEPSTMLLVLGVCMVGARRYLKKKRAA